MMNLRAVSRDIQRRLDKTRSWYFVERMVGFVCDRMLVLGVWGTALWLINGCTLVRLHNPVLWDWSAKTSGWLVLALAFMSGLPSVALVAAIAAYSVGYLTIYGQTPGMVWANMRLITNDGHRPGLGRVLARHMLSYVSFLALGLGYAWCMVDRQGRTWHDILSGTKVVRYGR